jgi:carbon monoxide dehydrogenase subunit G
MGLKLISAAAVMVLAAPAGAEVATVSEAGFASHNEARVNATPEQVWALMIEPGRWWNPDHSYSGDPANLSLTPLAGGCFCEALPGADGVPRGQVEHMRVIHFAPHTTLRMSGALGPLQGEALTGVLTMTLAREGPQTRISWDYVVGGYSRTPLRDLAPAVDQVVGEQLLRLAERLGSAWDGAGRRR